LKLHVSRLEAQGLVPLWEERLQNDAELKKQMQECHDRYADERWAMLTEKGRELVAAKGWEGAIGRGAGVAGIRYPGAIKCLHTHYGHYLGCSGAENLVGRWVQEALDAGA
ncbi:unnamed protein product, partial [Phaeothamnion confervicola]